MKGFVSGPKKHKGLSIWKAYHFPTAAEKYFRFKPQENTLRKCFSIFKEDNVSDEVELTKIFVDNRR